VAIPDQQMDGRALREAFGAYPTGVVAIVAQIGGRLVGLAASSFTSVSLAPPLVSVSIATSSTTWPDLRRAEHLGVTVLAEGQGALSRQLSGPARDRFAGVAFDIADSGAVMLGGGAAEFDCTVSVEIEAGDHVIVLLQLHAAAVHRERQPLIFHRSEFPRLASNEDMMFGKEP